MRFDPDRHLLGIEKLGADFTRRADRVAAAAEDFLTFICIYMRHHVADTEGQMTLADFHLDWVRIAETYAPDGGQKQNRHAFISPRESGKSTWFYLLAPLWYAVSGRFSFIAAFADSAPQAEEHLATLVREIETNELLRYDYPDLCTPRTRRRGVTESDRRGMYHSRSGFVFTARGIDSKVLGLKVGNLRPQLLICDDIEGDESTYSTDKVAKRLRTLQDAVLPLNEKAGVVITGTVTMAGSIIHQLVQAAHGDDTHTWITDERIVAHHHRPITQDNDGTERSTWPEKWPLAYLNTVRHTRSYAKNMDNRPMQADGEYWRPDHFRHTDDHPGASLTLLSVDPAVTGGTKADYTGLAVVQYRRTDGTMRVAASRTTRARGRQLRNLCIGLIEEYDVAVVLVETNQGGDLWTAPDGVFGGLGCKTITVHQTEPKTVRAERALKEYEAGRVVHAAGLADLETNMCAFPAVAHDDDVDAVVSAVVQLAARPRARRARAVQGSYG